MGIFFFIMYNLGQPGRSADQSVVGPISADFR
jgi:hypothetical protein